MKKKIIYILSTFIIMFMILLTSCNSISNIKEIRMKDSSVIEITAGDFSYEGKKVLLVYRDGKEVEIDLKEEMIPEAERLNFYKMGEHDVKVVYTNRLSTTMKIKVLRRDFDDIYELMGYTCTYDGKPHKVSLNYELPEGASIDYVYGNSFTNAGEYDVVGVISKNGYNSKTLTTRLIIEQAPHDTSGIVFNDLETTYDGEPKTIVATGLPTGVTASYYVYNEDGSVRVNNAVNAGKYKVVAKFSDTDNNHEQIPDMEAMLTIKKATYDMSNVFMNNVTKTYDGETYEAKLSTGSSLPEGVIVTFKCYDEDGVEVSSNAAAGEYKIVANFKGNTTNYEEIPSMEAKLIVEKKLVKISDKVSLQDQTVNFDREVHSLQLTGTLPEGVTVSFRNNDQIRAGEYKVTATFDVESANEKLDVDEMIGYLIINKITENIKVVDEDTGELRDLNPETDIVFDKSQASGLRIKGFDSEKYLIKYSYHFDFDGNFVVVYENNAQYKYRLVIEFVDQDEAKSVILSPVTGIFTYTD